MLLIRGLIMEKKSWHGTWPSNCDLCNTDLTPKPWFVDGRTIYGPWALMCPRCHSEVGVGLGIGKGQKYDSKTLENLKANTSRRML
jgi:hypothetical protein